MNNNQTADDPALIAFWAHMDRCALATMNRPDIKVTIIVRAPEALPSEAMVLTNDDLAVVRDALAYLVEGPAT